MRRILIALLSATFALPAGAAFAQDRPGVDVSRQTSTVGEAMDDGGHEIVTPDNRIVGELAADDDVLDTDAQIRARRDTDVDVRTGDGPGPIDQKLDRAGPNAPDSTPLESMRN